MLHMRGSQGGTQGGNQGFQSRGELKECIRKRNEIKSLGKFVQDVQISDQEKLHHWN